MPDRRWSDADRELVVRAWMGDPTAKPWRWEPESADRVLDALTAAGWRRKVETAEAIAEALLARDPAEWALAGQHAGEDAATIARAHATTPTEELEPELPRTPCPEGFHWIGQPLDSCDQCGLPAWEHEGSAVPNPDLASPFDVPKWVLEPWKPGEREAIRRRWDPNYAEEGDDG